MRNPPASRHGKAGTFSFADGHSESWRWIESSTPLLKGAWPAARRPTDRDLIRVKESTYAPGKWR